jgi:isoleucyl-tRNA synthetase
MDRLWCDLVPGGESVHFTLMPEPDKSLVDKDLEERMALAQKASSMVLALRKKVGIPVRQPLGKLLIPVISDKVRSQLEAVKGLILGEVNVKDMEFIADTTGVITKKIKPNFKTLGKVYGPRMKEIAAAFGTLDQPTISAIQASGDYTLSLPGGDVVLHAEDYSISSEDMPGWLVASEGSMTIALDIEITPALKQEGTARELINRIQNVRKDSGLEVTDRVEVLLGASGEAAEEIEACLPEWRSFIASQTLALSLELEKDGNKGAEVEWGDGKICILVTQK